MPNKFFITHSSSDDAFAKQLCDDLSARGLEGFLDVYSIKPGDVFSEKIADGLKVCDIFVPILSHVALNSPWCKEEINAAITLSNSRERNGRPRIIPVLIEECQNEMLVFLRSRHCVDFTGNYANAFQLLTEGFDVLSGTTSQSEPLPVPFSKSTSQKDLAKLNELVEMGEDLIKKRIPVPKFGSNPVTRTAFISNADDLVDRQSAQKWGMLCLSTLSRLFGANRSYVRKFDEQFKNFPNYTPTINALGILKAAKADYESNV